MIQVLKIVSGEELIADVDTKSTTTHYFVRNPATLIAAGNQVGLRPWIIFAKRPTYFELRKDAVLAITEPSEEAIKMHDQMFGASGLVVAHGGIQQ